MPVDVGSYSLNQVVVFCNQQPINDWLSCVQNAHLSLWNMQSCMAAWD